MGTIGPEVDNIYVVKSGREVGGDGAASIERANPGSDSVSNWVRSSCAATRSETLCNETLKFSRASPWGWFRRSSIPKNPLGAFVHDVEGVRVDGFA